MKTVWKYDKIKNLILENDKSKIKVQEALTNGQYPFFTSGDKILSYSEWLVDDENIFLSTGGVAGINYFKGKCAYSTDTYSVKGQNVNTKLLYYLIYKMIDKINNIYFQGTGLKHLQKKGFKNIKLKIPEETDIQDKIADVLFLVDNNVEQIKKVIEKAEKLKKSMMQNLLTGRMKPDGTYRKKEEFYEDEKLGLIPKGWEIKKGWEITEKITKGQSPKWQGFDYGSEGVLFITSENVRDGWIDIDNKKYLPLEFNYKMKNSQLKKGDILINIVGASIGRSSIFDYEIEFANINQAVCLFRLKNEYCSNFFKYYFQLNYTIHRLMCNQVETARANLSLGDFRKLKFVFPKDSIEQKEIASRIDVVNNKIISNKQKIQSLEKLKKSLMQNLLTGKIEIPETLTIKQGAVD